MRRAWFVPVLLALAIAFGATPAVACTVDPYPTIHVEDEAAEVLVDPPCPPDEGHVTLRVLGHTVYDGPWPFW